MLKGPPTATDRQTALVIHSTALGVEGTRVKVKAGHPELEGEASSILPPCSSQSLTTTLPWGSGSWGKTRHPGSPCSARQTWLLSPHLPGDQAPTCNPGDRKAAPGRLRRDSTSPDHSPTQAGCPCLPNRLQARRKQTGPPMRPRSPRPGSVHTTLGGAAGGSLPALPVGQGSLQTANRWLSTRTARAGFERVPEHRKLQVSSSAPSKFSSTRIYTEKGRGVCTSCPFVSGFLCRSVSSHSAFSYARMHRRMLRLLVRPPGLMLTSTNRTASDSIIPSLQQTRPKLRAERYIMHKAGLKDSLGDHPAPHHAGSSSGSLPDGFTTVHSAASREVDTSATGTA